MHRVWEAVTDIHYFTLPDSVTEKKKKMDFELIPNTAQAPLVKPKDSIDDVDDAKEAGMYTDAEELQVSVFDDASIS